MPKLYTTIQLLSPYYTSLNKASQLAQERSFATVVNHIKKTPKLVTIHSRGAEDAVLDLLRNGGAGPSIFHWFSGSKRQLGSLLDAGHRISLNTSMISTAKWAEFISFVPRSAILTETDGPFVKINTPSGNSFGCRAGQFLARASMEIDSRSSFATNRN